MADPEGEGNVVVVPANAVMHSGECLIDLETSDFVEPSGKRYYQRSQQQ